MLRRFLAGALGDHRHEQAAPRNAVDLIDIGDLAADLLCPSDDGRVVRRSGLLHRAEELQRFDDHLRARLAREPAVTGWQHVISPETTKPAGMAGSLADRSAAPPSGAVAEQLQL